MWSQQYGPDDRLRELDVVNNRDGHARLLLAERVLLAERARDRARPRKTAAESRHRPRCGSPVRRVLPIGTARGASRRSCRRGLPAGGVGVAAVPPHELRRHGEPRSPEKNPADT